KRLFVWKVGKRFADCRLQRFSKLLIESLELLLEGCRQSLGKSAELGRQRVSQRRQIGQLVLTGPLIGLDMRQDLNLGLKPRNEVTANGFEQARSRADRRGDRPVLHHLGYGDR